MPQLRSVAKLTDLVYQPVSELIKQEALRVSNNCVTKFHLDEEDEKTEEVLNGISDHYKDVTKNETLAITENENNTSSPILTLEEHIKRRKVRILHLLMA